MPLTKVAYSTLVHHEVAISHCTDHVSQRSIYFADPDGNRLEIYYEVPDARHALPRRPRRTRTSRSR